MTFLTADPITLLAFAALAVALIPVAQLVFLGLGRLEGYSVTGETGANANAALGIRNAAFLLSVVIAFQGIARTGGVSLRADLLALASYALLAIVLLAISRVVNDKLILYRWDNNREVVQEGNVGVALVEGATYFATALIMVGAAGSSDPALTEIIWFVIGQAMLVLLAFLYQVIVPGVHHQLDDHNLACGISLAGLLASGGIALGAAVSGPSVGWAEDLMATGAYLLGWLVFMAVAMLIANRVILPSANLRQQVMEIRNVAAGVIEAAAFIAFTLLYLFITG